MVLIFGGYGALVLISNSYALTPRHFLFKVFQKTGMETSLIARKLKPRPVKPVDLALQSLDKTEWLGHGASCDRILAPVNYNSSGRPVPGSWVKSKKNSFFTREASHRVTVSNSDDLLTAIRHARPGDVITLSPGKYILREESIYLSSGGYPTKPITVRAEQLGETFLELNSTKGFYINSPYWIFENLDIEGVCPTDDECDHAFHIVGEGHGFVLRNSRIHEFNSPIKANRLQIDEKPRISPDGILLEGNTFYNTRARQTGNPVTFIDVVGADHFIVSNNLIADFQKAQGDNISYGVQIKGGSAFGVLEKNLVICEYRTTGGVRIGLSFGGGGTGKQFLEPSDVYEHSEGIARNNIVMYCSDMGLYLNKSHDTLVFNNTFYATNGIDVRFPESTALLVNNLLSGNIWVRDGGKSVQRNNLIGKVADNIFSFMPSFNEWFADPAAGDFRLKNSEKIVDRGETSNLVWEDFCGNQRAGEPDIGALEYGGLNPCFPWPAKFSDL